MNLRQWRLIYDSPTQGAENMARDEALMDAVSKGDAPPTLRLYGWQPHCLSLGYAQPSADADVARIQERGWELVRRPTGGRAILHGDELTYSVAIPINHPLAEGTVVESYRRISEALLCALQLLDISTTSEKQSKRTESLGPVCFEVPSHYEITYNQRKLIGSAQVRRRTGLLQHGSLPLGGDLGRICDALHFPDEQSRTLAKAKVRARAITLSEAAGRTVSWDEVAQAFVEGFSVVFGYSFTVGTYTPEELAMAQKLMVDFYQNPRWLHKR